MSLIILSFPCAQRDQYWWRVEDQKIIDSGADYASIDMDLIDDVVAIMPMNIVNIQYHDFEGLTQKQALGAAKLEAQNKSINTEKQHICAVYDSEDNDRLMSITTADQLMKQGLADLAHYNINPDMLIPSAMLLPAVQDAETVYCGEVCGEKILRRQDAMCTDEDALHAIFTANKNVKIISAKSIEAAMAALPGAASVNVLQGAYAKKSDNFKITSHQSKRLFLLAALLVLVSLLLALAHYARYTFGANALNREALFLADTVDVRADTVLEAQTQLNKKLREEGLGAHSSNALVALVFSAMTPNAKIQNLSYTEQGFLALTLDAPRSEDINPILINLQQ